MARRGSFGLQPRVAPNITATLIALAREYEAKRDSNIMEAWRNGGTFEGKKVTDDMVLAYWKERQDGLDKGDPTYEEAANNVMQLQYAIEQSKQDLLHVQGRISDTQYANFFLKWSKKVPKNSEFYRTLQKDAAQLIESAKAKSRADAERAKTEAFNKFVSNTTEDHIAIGDALTKAITDLAKESQISVTGNGDLLLERLTKDVKDNPGKYNMLIDAIKKDDPNWNGVLTNDYFTKHVADAAKGYELIADRAQKNGYVTAYANASEGQANMTSWGQNVKAWPVAQSYSFSEQRFLKVMENPNASVMDKQYAASKFSEQLTTMANTPGIDPATKAMLQADAARLLGQDAGDSPSFGSAMLGRRGVDPQMTAQFAQWAETKAQFDANPTAWAYAPVDGNGNFDPTGQGSIGMVPAAQVPPGSQAVLIPGITGQATLAMIAPKTVYAIDPNNPNADPRAIGSQIKYNIGGRTITMWGYSDTQGNKHWSVESPIADGATTQYDSKGDVYITPKVSNSPQAQIAAATHPDGTPLTDTEKAALLSGGSIDYKSDTSEKDKAGQRVTTTVQIKDGYLQQTVKTTQVDAKGNVTGDTTVIQPLAGFATAGAFSPSRMQAGELPGITFTSPLQASVKAANYTQTADQVTKNASDPAFQQAWLNQTMQTMGITDPADPRIAGQWMKLTTVQGGQGISDYRVPNIAQNRTDLTYPGATSQSSKVPDYGINYGIGNTLTLPGLPGGKTLPGLPGQSYKNNPAKGVTEMIASNILPGLGVPAQTPAGSPNIVGQTNVTPTSTNTTISGVTPNSSLASTPAPTSTTGAASTPAPTATPSPLYRNKPIPQ